MVLPGPDPDPDREFGVIAWLLGMIVVGMFVVSLYKVWTNTHAMTGLGGHLPSCVLWNPVGGSCLSAKSLCVFRGVMAAWLTGVAVAGCSAYGLNAARFYTIWNFGLLAVYFIVGFFLSTRALYYDVQPHADMVPQSLRVFDEEHSVARGRPQLEELDEASLLCSDAATLSHDRILGEQTADSENPAADAAAAAPAPAPVFPRFGLVERAHVALYHTLFTTVLLVTTMFWGVLLPAALMADKDTSKMTSFVSVQMHACNSVWMLVEFSALPIPFVPHYRYYVLAWAAFYCVWEWVQFYAWTYQDVYFFMSTATWTALIWYPVVLGLHMLYFSLGRWLTGKKFEKLR
jgi:hypothetical protein